MVDIFKKHDIKYVLLNGGNGTMDACGHIYEVCKDQDIKVVGIPKTIDNDIAMTDHSPGYGSAARFIAASTQEVGEDVKSLPIHVCIMEAMGRNAGWITAASALARRKQGDAPHLIYLPERNFNEDEFLEDVSKLQKKQGGVVVLVSEGLHDANGESIVPPIFKSERAVYYGDVSSHLANLVVKKLGVKARSEKPGLCGRASVALQSPVDREEAHRQPSWHGNDHRRGRDPRQGHLRRERHHLVHRAGWPPPPRRSGLSGALRRPERPPERAVQLLVGPACGRDHCGRHLRRSSGSCRLSVALLMKIVYTKGWQ